MTRRDGMIPMETAPVDALRPKPVLWLARELQSILGGKWFGEPPGDFQITGVNYYSSQVEPGDLVFTTDPGTWKSAAYKDTHGNIPRFFTERHAAAVVTDRLPGRYQGSHPILLVDNTRQALDRLGRAARDRMRGTVLAITGSAGKTTTKELTRFLLSRQDRTKGSRKNYNHGPGVSLMLAETPPGTRFGVYEFSVDLPRVTAAKAAILRPHVAVITNIHPDHLQFYGTLERLTDQKCLLFKSLMPGGVAVLNRDAVLFERQVDNAERAGIRNFITFGLHEQADMKAISCSLHPDSSDVTVSFQHNVASFRINQPGKHIVMDCLCALAAVHAAGGDWLRAAEDIAGAPIPGRRNEQHSIEIPGGRITLIDDTFSANPASIQAGLGVVGLTGPPPGGRRIAVIGEIKELGETSPQLHTALAPHVLTAGIDVLFTVGRDLQGIWTALPANMKGRHSEDPQRIARALVEEIRPGDIVWVKGSRRSAANLETILSAIKGAGKDGTQARNAMNESPPPRHPHIEAAHNATAVPDGSRAQRGASAIEVVFVGDTAFGENYQEQYAQRGETNILEERGYDAPLAKVRSFLLEADLVIANLETPLTDLRETPLAGRKTWIHRGDPRLTPRHLMANNIKVVGLANNHMLDYGQDGFLETIASLDTAGIPFFGGGKTLSEAGQSFIWQRQVLGQTFTLAVIGMFVGPAPEKDVDGVYATKTRPGLNPVSLKQLGKEIRRIREHFRNACIVLFPHWGANYRWRTERQARLAERMLAQGADLIIGHGGHMVQEIGTSLQRWIVFGIGNFMFNSKGRYGRLGAPPFSSVASLRLEILPGSLGKSLRLYPIVTDNRRTDYQTRFVAEDEFHEVVALLRTRSMGIQDFSGDIRCGSAKSSDTVRYFLEMPLGESG